MNNTHRISRRNLLLGCSGLAACAVANAWLPGMAFGDPLLDTRQELEQVAEQIVDAQLEVEEKTDEYHKAQEEYLAAKAEVDESKRIVAKNNEEIDGLQDKLANNMKASYRSNSLGFIDVVLGSTSFTDLVTRWEQYDRLNDAEAALIAKAKDLKERNEAEKAQLETRQSTAREKYDACNALRREAQDKLDELEKMQAELGEEYEDLLEEIMGAALAEALKNIKIQITGNPNGLDPALAVVEYAMSRLGCPYVWAAEGPTTFDCSGLVMWCFAQVGISVPHYTESQYALALSRGAVLALKDVKPGDVLYRPGHVGIAIEDGGLSYIHAPHTGDVVRIATYQQFVCGLRFAGAVNKSVEEARADAESKPKEDDSSAKEKQKQEAKQKEQEAAAKAKAEAEAKAKVEAEEKAKAEAEAKAKAEAEAEAKAKAEAEAKAKAEAEEKAKAEAEAKAKAEAEAKAKAEAEAASEQSSDAVE